MAFTGDASHNDSIQDVQHRNDLHQHIPEAMRVASLMDDAGGRRHLEKLGLPAA
jgi:hypothetical protein